MKRPAFIFTAIGFCFLAVFAQSSEARVFSGAVTLTQQFELVPNVSIEIRTADGKLRATLFAKN